MNPKSRATQGQNSRQVSGQQCLAEIRKMQEENDRLKERLSGIAQMAGQQPQLLEVLELYYNEFLTWDANLALLRGEVLRPIEEDRPCSIVAEVAQARLALEELHDRFLASIADIAA